MSKELKPCIHCGKNPQMKESVKEFSPNIWSEIIKRILKQNYLPQNYGIEDSTVEFDQKKWFAFKVDDIAKAQSNINIMNSCIDRCKVAINLALDYHFFERIKHSNEFKLPYNLEVRDVEYIRLQDSFGGAIKGCVYYGINEKS